MRNVQVSGMVLVCAVVISSWACAGEKPPPQPPGPQDRVITHSVGSGSAVGGFDYITPATPKAHIVTTHDATHYLVPPGTLQDGSYSSETVWVREEDTRDKNWYRASSVPGRRVNAVITGVYGVIVQGGKGGPAGPGKPTAPPIWTTMSVDLDIDADTNRDGQSNLGEDRLVDAAEDKDEDNPKDNPLGAIAAVGKPSRLLLRRILPAGIPKGRVIIIQETARDEKDKDLPRGEVRITRKGDGSEVRTLDLQPQKPLQKPDDLWDEVRENNLELLMEGVKEGVVLLTARYQLGESVDATAFEDKVRVTVANIEFKLLLGHIDPVTGRGMAGPPEQVLYEPGDLPVPASNPVPKVKLSKVEVGAIRGGLDSAIQADIRVQGEVHYPLADIIEGDSANPKKVFVEVNGQPLQTLDLTAVAEAPCILRPFARKFTYSGTLSGVPLALEGFSELIVKCKDPVVGNVGHAGARIEIEPVTSAEPYDQPVGDSMHPVISGGTAQPLKVLVDLGRAGSLQELAAMGPRAIRTRAKLSFGGDRTDSAQRGGLQLAAGQDPVIVLEDGVSKITIKDATELTFDNRQEAFKAEVYMPEKWPDAVEMTLVETGPGTSVFQCFLVGVELTTPGGELDPEKIDVVTIRVKAVGYNEERFLGEWEMIEEDAESLSFWTSSQKVVGLKIECLTPPSKWSYGFMRMRVFNGQAWGVDGMPVDVGQKYIGVSTYDQEHLIQEVPGALEARLKLAEGPWRLREVVMLQESQLGPYAPFVARLSAPPAAVLAEITSGTKCKVFDKEHNWSAEYGATWCGGSSKPGVYTMMELPVPGEDFGAGHLDDDARFIFFSTSGKKGYELIQSKRKDACRVAGKLFEVLRQVAAKRRQDRLDPAKDPGRTYLHLKGPSFSTPKRYRQMCRLDNKIRLLPGIGTAHTETEIGVPLEETRAFLDYFVPTTDEYMDPRLYFGAVLRDFLRTGYQDYMAQGWLHPDPNATIAQLALDKIGTSCGLSPIFSGGPNGLYHCAQSSIVREKVRPGVFAVYPIGVPRGLVVKAANYPVEGWRTFDKDTFPGMPSLGLRGEWAIPKDGLYAAGELEDIVKGKEPFILPVPKGDDKLELKVFRSDSLVLVKHTTELGVHSIGSRYLVGQHTPFRMEGFGETEDPLSNTQNRTQILHFNSGMAYNRFLPHVKELLAIIKEGGWRMKTRLLEYMEKYGLVPAQEQKYLNAVAKLPNGVSIAACFASRDHQFKEMLIALKMVQTWEKQTGKEPSPLDFFAAYDIASGECFHLFGADPFNDVIATQAGYLFSKPFLSYKLLPMKPDCMDEIMPLVTQFEMDMKTARKQFRAHPSLNYGLGDGSPKAAKDALLKSFLAMHMSYDKKDGKYVFVPIVAEWEDDVRQIKGGVYVRNKKGEVVTKKGTVTGKIWSETIGTVVDANIKVGKFAAADDPKHERIDDAKEQAFLNKVKELLTVPAAIYMAAEYEGSEATISPTAMLKLNEVVETLMFIDEDP